MPVRKTPEADLRRRQPLYAEIGMIVALVAVITAFTVPTPPPAPVVVAAETDVPFEMIDVPPTAEPPPPPPPAAPPPPVAVPDEVRVEDLVRDLELDLGDETPPPATPPAPPSPPVVDPSSVPPPPPPPVVEDIPDTDAVFEVAEVQPELIGGLPGLQGRVEYPEFARRAGIEGQVVVQFVVDERGNVVDPVVLRSPNDLLSEAALKAVRESRFTPGQQRGRPVKVRFAVPVTFRLR